MFIIIIISKANKKILLVFIRHYSFLFTSKNHYTGCVIIYLWVPSRIIKYLNIIKISYHLEENKISLKYVLYLWLYHVTTMRVLCFFIFFNVSFSASLSAIFFSFTICRLAFASSLSRLYYAVTFHLRHISSNYYRSLL